MPWGGDTAGNCGLQQWLRISTEHSRPQDCALPGIEHWQLRLACRKVDPIALTNGYLLGEHTCASRHFTDERFDSEVCRRRADSYREQLQVHRANGGDYALRFRIQARKNVV